jgi:MFS family permease
VLVVLLLPGGQQQINEKRLFVREELSEQCQRHDECREQIASEIDKNVSAVDSNSETPQRKAAWRLFSVWDVMLARFLLGAAVLVYRHDFVSTVIHRFNSSSTAAGYVSSFASFVGTATGFVVGFISDRYNNDSQRLFFHSAILQSISLMLLAVSPNVVLLALSQASLSASCAIGRVAAVEVTVLCGGKQHAGTLMGAGATFLSLARMLSPFISGLSQEFDEDFGPVLLSILLAIAGTSLLFPMQKSYYRTELKSHSD